MTDREKLIELIIDAKRTEPDDVPFGDWLVTYLLANGVTFATDTNDGREWTKADQPPEDWKGEGGYLTSYYIYTPEYGVDIGSYMKPANKWLCSMGIPCIVTHWMPLPEPPREADYG